MTRRRIASRGLCSGMGHPTEKGWLAQFPNVGCERHVLGSLWTLTLLLFLGSHLGLLYNGPSFRSHRPPLSSAFHFDRCYQTTIHKN